MKSKDFFQDNTKNKSGPTPEPRRKTSVIHREIRTCNTLHKTQDETRPNKDLIGLNSGLTSFKHV